MDGIFLESLSLCPVWFTGPQFPRSCTKKKQTKQIINYDGGMEESDVQSFKPPPPQKKDRQNRVSKNGKPY